MFRQAIHLNDVVSQVSLACVASVSVRFRRKERGTRVKDREKSGASKRAGRGWPSFPSPSPLFHFLALVSFLARSIPKVPFLGISWLQNQTETLATQAKVSQACLIYRCSTTNLLFNFLSNLLAQ